MARQAHAVPTPVAPGNAGWWTFFAALGAVASSASLWVHYRLLHDPLYTSFCDVSSTFSCTEAYTSVYGMTLGVPTALVGLVFFAAVLVLIALCSRSAAARAHLPGYVFAARRSASPASSISRMPRSSSSRPYACCASAATSPRSACS